MLTFASMKFNPKFLVSMAFFLDDLYYYRYHHNNYTKSAKLFMNKIELVNLIRMNSDLLSFIQGFDRPLLGVDQNVRYLSYFPNNTTSSAVIPESVYFLSSLECIYKEYVVFLIIAFGSLKVLAFISKLMGRRVKLFKKIHLHISIRTTLFIFASSLVLDKMADVCFGCSLQLFTMSRFNFKDSVNMGLCALVFFAVLMYVLMFYVNCKRRKRS